MIISITVNALAQIIPLSLLPSLCKKSQWSEFFKRLSIDLNNCHLFPAKSRRNTSPLKIVAVYFRGWTDTQCYFSWKDWSVQGELGEFRKYLLPSKMAGEIRGLMEGIWLRRILCSEQCLKIFTAESAKNAEKIHPLKLLTSRRTPFLRTFTLKLINNPTSHLDNLRY